MKKFFISIFLLIVLIFSACGIKVVKYNFDYPVYANLTDITSKADLIFEGKVIDSYIEKININQSNNLADEFRFPATEGQELKESEFIYTIYKIKINSVKKGNLSEDTDVEVKIFGGIIGNTKYTDDFAVDFKMDENFIFFANSFKNESMPLSLINPIQGYYKIENGNYIANSENKVIYDSEIINNI